MTKAHTHFGFIAVSIFLASGSILAGQKKSRAPEITVFCPPSLTHQIGSSSVEAVVWKKFQTAESLIFSSDVGLERAAEVKEAFQTAKREVFQAVLAMNDANVRQLVDSFVDRYMQKQGYLPGGLPRAESKEPVAESMADFIAVFVRGATPGSDDYLRHVLANLRTSISKDFFDSQIDHWLRSPQRQTVPKIVEEVSSKELRVIDASALEVFRRRLRDGTWSLIDDPATAKRYRELFEGESGLLTGKRLREMREWRDFEI